LELYEFYVAGNGDSRSQPQANEALRRVVNKWVNVECYGPDGVAVVGVGVDAGLAVRGAR
jgi:hypothetical protein